MIGFDHILRFTSLHDSQPVIVYSLLVDSADTFALHKKDAAPVKGSRSC